MATVLLVRHGRSSANHGGVLAGRTPGVRLDDVGQQQAKAVGERVAILPIVTVVSSPLERCRETADALAAQLPGQPPVQTEERLTECGYGAWTGQELKKLAKDKLWKVVQHHPSGATFPDGESLREMQARAVAAIREWDERVTTDHDPDALWVAVSHGDVIKSVIADALGTHLDNFQRIVVDPGSVSAIAYTPLRPFVLRLNDLGDLSGLKPPKRRRRRKGAASEAASDAAVGGGAGS